jgi:adenine-specific DNA-methyltransferase
MSKTPRRHHKDDEGVNTARRLAAALGERARVGFARAFTALVIDAYWHALQERYRLGLCLRTQVSGLQGIPLAKDARGEAERLGLACAEQDPIEAGYRIGCIYTAALPPRYRSEYGAYYTPPALSSRLIDMCTRAGVDWKTCRVLDGSCGGAAFLAPVALRMLTVDGSRGAQAFGMLTARLKGFEVDPFAAWMSQVLVEAAVLPVCEGQRLPEIIDVCNSLERELADNDRFDLVIGNPP